MPEWHIVHGEKIRERERAEKAEQERDEAKAEIERLRKQISDLGNTQEPHDF